MRYDNWKIVFMEQRCQGTLQVWAEPFTRLRLPKLFNLRTDPYEFADITSNTYYDWFLHHDYIIFGADDRGDKFAETFKEFPPIQKPNSFTIDDAIKTLSESANGGRSTGSAERGGSRPEPYWPCIEQTSAAAISRPPRCTRSDLSARTPPKHRSRSGRTAGDRLSSPAPWRARATARPR